MARASDLLKRKLSVAIDEKFPADSFGSTEIRYATKRFTSALANVGYTEEQLMAVIAAIPEISEVRRAS